MLGGPGYPPDRQSADVWVHQLVRAGCKTALREVATGAKTDRCQLRRAIDQLAAGGALMVTRFARLVRSPTKGLGSVHWATAGPIRRLRTAG